MPALADMALWTPVALNLAPPAAVLDWGDLRRIRFTEPFFDQTVERWAGGDPAPLVRTDLDALTALDDAPSLDPSLLVFHLSRCGSTLLSRLLASLPQTLVVAEPAPLNAIVEIDPARVDRVMQARVLRLLVRALGRRRFGDERHYVLKLSSWNIRRIALFRAAFPGVPAVWVQREPAAVMASLLARPAGWMRLQQAPARAANLLGDEVAAAGIDRALFVARALAAMLEAAAGEGGPEHVVDYAELPEAAWTRVAPLLGLDLAETDIALMRTESTYDSKDRSRRVFAGDPPERRALAAAMRNLAAARATPLYDSLAARPRG